MIYKKSAVKATYIFLLYIWFSGQKNDQKYLMYAKFKYFGNNTHKLKLDA